MVDGSYRHCFETASRAAGRTLNEEELDTLFSRAHRRIQRLQDEGMTPRDAAMEAGKRLGDEARRETYIQEANQKKNLAIRHGLSRRIRDGEEAISLDGILAGERKGNARNASMSVASRVRQSVARYHGVLTRGLNDAGLLKVARRARGPIENDIAQDIAHLNNPERYTPSGNKIAHQIAQVYQRAMEGVRIEQNAAGADIGKDALYVARQSHDMLKVRGKGPIGDFQAWHDAIRPLLDDRTFDELPEGMNETEYLRNIWRNLWSGVHEGTSADWLSGFKGPANMAKKVSQERVLHFKGPQEWMAYNRKFGTGSLHDAVMKSVTAGSRNAAIMRELGTNPEAMFDHVLDQAIDRAKKRNDVATVDQLNKLKDHVLLDHITGKPAPVRDWRAARIGANIRALEGLTKLGGVVLSSLPDIAVRAASLRHNGIPLLESYWRAATDLLPTTGNMYRRRMAQSMGIGVQGMLGEMASRFGAEDGVSGMMANGVNWLHKLNGLTYWTDSLKAGTAGMLLNHLGDAASQTFDKLHPRMREALTRYGIEGKEWDAIRGAVRKGDDGHAYLMPGDIRDMDADGFEHLAAGKGGETRDDLADRLAAYVNDVADDAMSEPETRVAASLQAKYRALDGVSPWFAQAVRMIMQFKSYPMSFMRRAWDREVVRNGPDVPGLVHLMVGTTLLGYASMCAKSIAAGMNPRDPADPKTWMAAMEQGGGFGIYGDFLFGEQSRMGNSFWETLGGPALGDVANIYKALLNTRDESMGDKDAPKENNYLSNLVATARGFVPGGNIFWAKLAIDHMFYNQIQEAVNPGYLQRHEAAVMRSTGQTYMLSPSWSPYQAIGG